MSQTGAPPAPLLTRHSWVGGHEVEGRAGHRTVESPSDGRAFARTSLLDVEQAGDALGVALGAFPAWNGAGVRRRVRALQRLRQALVGEADEIARLVEREQGKPFAEVHAAEILPSLEALKHLAGHAEDLLREDPVEGQMLLLAHKEARLVYEPYGVVLAITPWNYPFGIPLPIVAAALVAGNTVVLKPAPSTTLIGLRIGELARRAGFPEGVVNVIAVDDTVAAALVEDPRVAKIVFTGSVATGKRVMGAAAKNLTPVLLELGGKDPAIVCRDADLERSARGIVWGAFMNAGQTCASVERVYVERPVAEPFLARVVEETRLLRLGGADGRPSDVGPLSLERQRKVVEGHVADARERGARVLTGGEASPGPGFFYPPTVLTEVDHTMAVMREETFGPLLPIMVVDSVDEAIRLANDSDYGLTASGWTQSRETARRLQRELRAGVVTINDAISSFGEPTAPWGGVKQSGVGRTHGRIGLREMVQPKYVSLDRSRGPELWWYPYDEAYGRLLSQANPALHARAPWRRLFNLIRLTTHRRLWRRLGLRRLLLNVDKLF
ncbi:MAG: aldehyde dehydrogenase family protein [Acidobacteria bacterium]|jgi:succinate-semialdehyde dehydrogenase/glutarate-semialdehyde dehydrogenase|nr:aldehyde dehydrogenase family protein [Acidobacteriota bacterium]